MATVRILAISWLQYSHGFLLIFYIAAERQDFFTTRGRSQQATLNPCLAAVLPFLEKKTITGTP
jgi:hypothetical protein